MFWLKDQTSTLNLICTIAKAGERDTGCSRRPNSSSTPIRPPLSFIP